MSVSQDVGVSAQGFTPVELTEVEIADALPALAPSPVGQSRSVWVLVRIATEPLGYLELTVDDAGLAPAELGRQIFDRFGAQVDERLVAAGRPPAPGLGKEGLGLDPGSMPHVQTRERLLTAAPLFSVVISTRDRAPQLARCLSRLAGQDYPNFEVVVVDNAPTNDAVRAVVREVREVREAKDAALDCRYVREDRPGLSRARNAGVAAARGGLIAFLDDDEEADPHWLAELLRGFRSGDNIGCVSGMILPAALDTQAQAWFEQLGGHSKGRGFTPAVFSARQPHTGHTGHKGHKEQSPLYPLPPFGAGGNMAFRREALAAIGGFDVALGAGTAARGAEDTYAFSRVLLGGYRMAYQPSALVRHHHYGDLAGLRRQLRGYGTGLTAYYAALVRRDPRVVGTLLALIPAALRDLRGRDSLTTATTGDLPPGLRREQWSGMLTGPFAYVRSAGGQARSAKRTNQ